MGFSQCKHFYKSVILANYLWFFNYGVIESLYTLWWTSINHLLILQCKQQSSFVNVIGWWQEYLVFDPCNWRELIVNFRGDGALNERCLTGVTSKGGFIWLFVSPSFTLSILNVSFILFVFTTLIVFEWLLNHPLINHGFLGFGDGSIKNDDGGNLGWRYF